MPRGPLKPAHRALKAYYDCLAGYTDQRVTHEGALRSAFQTLLADTARAHGWTLIPELSAKVGKTAGGTGILPVVAADPRVGRPGGTGVSPVSHTIRPDGTIRDANSLPRGYWEAKDTADDLDAEIVKKTALGYSLVNTIFEDTRTAVLFQGKREVLRIDLRDPQQLCDLLNQFYAYTEPDIADFEQAIDEFKQRVPELARGLADIIRESHDRNPKFQAAFDAFFTLCQTALNPNIARAAVDEMLIQHLLTERLIRKVFDNPEFTQRNVIAAEVEKVIAALVSRAFNRDEFLRSLDRFYVAIEHAARRCHDWNEKQHFLNTVYERFFQGYSVKLADTHGIVYTPQPIVDFMCASVAEVLQTEFGVALTDKSVQILDPCTGTGNFIVNLLRRMPQRDLPRMYKAQLFANEVMLLPYYIAALNIEHAYYELTGTYEPFEGLCFVDTLDLAESRQAGFSFMTQVNTQRVERQKKAPITVIIGNPPYNTRQQDENDNNRNRRYPVIDQRIRQTYAKDSRATNKVALSDAYVKFFRWGVDRLGGRDGILCFVSNNSFVDLMTFDGMRKHLLCDFSALYHVDLHGNVRQNPKLSGTTHNVFGIQVGVGITLAVRRGSRRGDCVHYLRVPEHWRKEEKLRWLVDNGSASCVVWQRITPDLRHSWLSPEHSAVFDRLLPLGTKAAKAKKSTTDDVVFRQYCGGLKSNRDDVVYDFRCDRLNERAREFAERYNAEVDRHRRTPKPPPIDEFIDYSKLKWDSTLKRHLEAHRYAQFDPAYVRDAMYRPFTERHLYFDSLLINSVHLLRHFLPTRDSERANTLIAVSGPGHDVFEVLISCQLVDLKFSNAANGGTQCFPFYVYDEDGSNRRENITDWALKLFRDHYHDPTIEKWDIFYYVYGVLHHPAYREKFADNLKRELPRIPLAPPLDVASAPRGRRDTGASAPTPDPNRDREGADAQRDGATAPLRSRLGSRRPGQSPHAQPRRPLGGDATSAGEAPAATGFWAFAAAGQDLAHWHLDYEQIEPYDLQFVEKKTIGPTRRSPSPLVGGTTGGCVSRPRTIDDLYRVEDKMRLSKDKTSLIVNPLLTLDGIPPQVFDYRLGNRSALDWVIDQYQVTTDKRSGVRSDPNRPDDPQYIVRLVGQVIRVSLETVRIVNSLPPHYAPEVPED